MPPVKPKNNCVLSIAEYKDKVLGCWMGKNIGGTLGGPFEGKREMFDLKFYAQDLDGKPAPNDDLDLQLVWLWAMENEGTYNLTERKLAEYWATCIVGPWNEYGVCLTNVRNGFYPPLSGSVNNETWKFSNGAWIRAEIWACMFPGAPDEAIKFAYMDSCCDHTGDGIYAEMFVAALESAAFFIHDIRELIQIGLSKIPEKCRIARSVKLACSCYDSGKKFTAARNAVVKDSEDLGWFQAPANIGFVILGLLYGEGDFGKSVCVAVNCGDDTDCTGATVGSILGIMNGAKAIPKKWIDPIGHSIQTVAIARFEVAAPSTLDELTERVVTQALLTCRENPALTQIAYGKTSIDKDYLKTLGSVSAEAQTIWNRSPYELNFDLPFGVLTLDYVDGVEIAEGVEKKIRIGFRNYNFSLGTLDVKFHLPEGWRSNPSAAIVGPVRRESAPEVEMTLIPGAVGESITYLPLEIRLVGRNNPWMVMVPFQQKGSVTENFRFFTQDYFDRYGRRMNRR